MGPGRRIYHKPCLKCLTCSRRLDALSLLEHDQEPYCKSCHVRNFGTRDLRSANLPPSSSPSTSPTRLTYSLPPTIASESFASNSSILEEPSRHDVDSGVSPRLSSQTSFSTSTSFPYSATQQLPPRRSSPITHGSPILRPSTRPLSPTKLTGARPLSPIATGLAASPLSPTSTGTSTASAPTSLHINAAGAPLKPNYTGRKTFGPSPGFEGTPSCPKCGKAVYFAEQVKASGRTWHKPCLRCTECSVSLDATRLTEKDGKVMCRSCYSKLHGPQGSGYALLGRAG
ncbi:LIM-domain-containing protein [Ramaria rubella]|nr:LIM-domain-containing protein [Ramaria rubella]